MKCLTHLFSQALRSGFYFALSLVQATGLAALFVTLILPPRYLLAEELRAAALAASVTPPEKLAPVAAPVTSVAPLPRALGAPVRPGPVMQEKWKPLAKRQPNEAGLYKSAVSLRALDLKRVPSENDLRMAGQMGSPLTPTSAAEPNAITDSTKRKKQEADNMLFGQAIQKWNQHDYKGAIALFDKHRMAYPDSAWAGEAELHLGCEAQFTGNWEEARVHFDQVLSVMPKGSDMYQKVKLRRAVLHMDQGELDLAVRAFTEMLQTETDWQRRTYAQRWLLDLSHFKGNQLALRTCGSNSVAFVLRSLGKDDVAAKIASVSAPGEQGFSLRELTELANKAGLQAVAVRAEGTTDLERLPTPFIAHYRDQHFVVVKNLAENGDVQLYDPRLEHETRLSAEVFRNQWSDLAVLFQAKPEGIQLASINDLDQQVGGCCGIPRFPGGLGPICPIKCCGMPGWSVNPVNFNVCVQDIPMWHDNQFGPGVEIKLTYNSQDSLVQMRPVGNKWVLNYASYAMESPGNEPSGSVLIVMPDGSGDIYQPDGNGGYNPSSGVFNTLTKADPVNHPYAFDVKLPDGTTYHYDVPPEMGSGSFSSLLLSITDRYGSAVTISHNTDGSIHQLVDSLNKQWTFTYNAQGYLANVSDQFSRQATFSYDSNGNLTAQTDMGGVSYGYTYDSNIDLTSLIKPSGTTQFYIEPAEDGTQGTQNISNGTNEYPQYGAAMWANYRVTVTDPQGYAEEYYFDGYFRYGWHRDQNQFQSPLPALQAPHTRFDYTLLSTNGKGLLSKVTYADGQYIQYAYSNSNSPANLLASQITQSVVLPSSGVNAVNETTNFTYNAQGQVLTRQDARANTTHYQYYLNGTVGDNGFDLATATDSLNHVKSTFGRDLARNVNSFTNATNNTTQFTYNTLGQRSGVTNAAEHDFTYNYNTLHQLISFSQGSNILRSLTYDNVGRIQSNTDADGHTLIYEYDDLNRITKIIYPDSTYELNNYSCCWLESQTDRLGRNTSYICDFRGKPLVTRRPDDTVVQSVYDPVGNQTYLFDGNAHATQWVYDARNRVSDKIYADGSRYAFVYDGVGNLTTRTDAKNVTVNYTYDANNNLTGITAPGLAPITYAYDERNLMNQMIDGTGTTVLGYDLAGRHNSTSGPSNDDAIALIYDAMGRVSTQTINGRTSTYAYNDSLERLTGYNTPIGNFTYAYRTALSRKISSTTYPNGQNTTVDYYGSEQDNRQSQITNSTSGGILSQFGYQYDASGQISQWIQQLGNTHPLAYQLQEDALGQLIQATVKDVVTTSVVQTYGYGYDNAGNRVTDQMGANLSQDAYNEINQFTNRQGSGFGMMPFRGVVNEPATVHVNGSQVSIKANGSFATAVNVVPGNNTVTVSATDRNSNIASHNYQITVAASGDNRTLSYDANGNLQTMVVAGVATTYEWDALDRLTAITRGNERSEFFYDGLSQIRRIKEKINEAVTGNKHLIWIGPTLAELRDDITGVTKTFTRLGMKVTGGKQAGNYYYTLDHLGSVRELTDANQSIRARYSYDLWGKRTKLTGDMDAELGFTGHYVHASTQLCLTLYRAYDAELGRWLSRDPLVERGGLNLYAYVKNEPCDYVDPDGLEACPSGQMKDPVAVAQAQKDRKACMDDAAEARDEIIMLGMIGCVFAAAGGTLAGAFGFLIGIIACLAAVAISAEIVFESKMATCRNNYQKNRDAAPCIPTSCPQSSGSPFTLPLAPGPGPTI